MSENQCSMRIHAFVVLAALIATAALAASSCTVKDALFCDATHPCSDPSRPYCDLTGDYDPDHIRNSCVPDPFPPPDARPDATPSDASLSAAMLTTNEPTHDYNGVLRGSESLPVQFIVTNEGQMTSGSIAASVGGTNSAAFIIVPTGDSSDCVGQMLAPTNTCVVQVKYRPDASGSETAELHIDASPGGMKIVGLSGEGLVQGSLEVTVPASGVVSFTNTAIQSMTASQAITIHNKGGVACTNLTVTLNDTTNYTKTSTTCATSLGSDATCDIDVRFNPTTVGTHPSSVTVTSDQGAVTPQLQGTGTATVTVMKVGTGSVADTLPSPIISCGGACSGTYGQTPITLHASTTGGIPFDSWGGACASVGSNPDCSLALTQPTETVSAMFGVCVPGTGMCATGMSQTCDSTGHWTTPSTCALGCYDTTRCADVNPSNGLAAALDAATSQPAFTLMDGAQIDTTTGIVVDGNGTSPNISSMEVDQGANLPKIRVFEVASISMGSTTVVGSDVFAIASDGDIEIVGPLSATGFVGTGVSFGAYSGPGGGGCGGLSYSETGPDYAGAGGGNLGVFTAAGGGNNSPNTGHVATGTITDRDTFSPIRGGCVGEQIPLGGTPPTTVVGGGGGGAVQLVSRTSIRLSSNGIINVGGGGAPGPGGFYAGGGGGGGSGGEILLEAPDVVITGSSSGLAANGGGGSCTTLRGEDGKPSVIAAKGGQCTSSNATKGGDGATVSPTATRGGDFTTGTSGFAGGGGGGMGQYCVHATTSGFVMTGGAFISVEGPDINGCGSLGTR